MRVEPGPRRVHDLELFAVALTLLSRGPVPEDEIIRRLRAKARELHRRRAGMGYIASAEGKGRTLAKGTVRETIAELARFGLVTRPGGSAPRLTRQGEEVAKQFATDHSNPVGMRMLTAHHLRLYANLRSLVARLQQAPDGLLFIPRPSPTDLAISIASHELGAYEPYIKAASEYTAIELRQWGLPRLRADGVYGAVRKEAVAKAAAYARIERQWTHPIMIATVRDALSRYALNRLVPSLGVVDFEIYCSRGSTLGLLNYTDRLTATFGRVVYCTSWTDTARVPVGIKPNALTPIEVKTGDGKVVYELHTPEWRGIRTRFLAELTQAYERLNVEKRSLYVVIADVRDIVCYRLRLPDAGFDRFLTKVYHEAMQGKVQGIRISLEADEVKEARGDQSTKRNPLYLGAAAPRTMIHISRRDR